MLPVHSSNNPKRARNSIAARARVLYLVLPAVALAFWALSSSFTLRAIMDDSTRRLTQQYSIETAANFLISTTSHFVLMRQLSHSTTIARWLADEDNVTNKVFAFEEIMGYAAFSPDIRLMFTAYETLRSYDFHVDLTLEEFAPWGRLAGGEVSEWFFNTRDAEIPFILNIQRDRPVDDLYVLYVWSNHRMYYRGRFVGVVTVGSPFERVFDFVFGAFEPSSKRGYIIDRDGAVRVDSARLLAVTQNGLPALPALPEAAENPILLDRINDHFHLMTGGIFQPGDLHPHEAFPLARGVYRYASIAPIVGTDWLMLVLSNQTGDLGWHYISLFFSAFVVLALSVLAGSALVRRMVLLPLFKLTESTASVTSTTIETDFFGLDRDDEIGDLARTIQDMRNSLNSVNTELRENELVIAHAQHLLKYREKLLYTVNQAAEVLLTASEGNTMKALLEGMEIVGRCLDLDRVQIWRNEEIDGELYFVLRYEWLSDFGKQKAEVPIGLKFPYSSKPGWLEMFSRGKYMNTPISKLPPEDMAFLSRYEILSIVNIPLFLNGEFTGFFSVDDCRQERVFSDDETKMFMSAGMMFTSVFNRNQQSEKIAEANRQLESALGEALSASRTKSNFLSTMSHEMRTPMNAIIGMAAIAKKAETDERKNYALNKVEKAASHLLGVINEVLDISKIEANKFELQQVEIDLRNLIQKAASLVEFPMEEKRHRFSINIDSSVPPFYTGDDQRLTQIITNLLTNAVTYTPEEGEISLDVSLTKNENGICDLRFTVKDSGMGIAPEDQKRLFDMFEQVGSDARRKYGGTGLGLAIAKRLVELMDGTISVESEHGKGSQFTFTVKLRRLEKTSQTRSASGHAESHDRPNATASTSMEDGKFAGKRLLLAEDIELNREILIAQLDGTGLLIDIAQNGKEAFKKITMNPGLYDLVFMDIQMPKMDGLEATRRIRSLPTDNARNLPIIAMTANVFADDVKKCLEAGMNDHIGKPLDMRIVFDKLCKYLYL